MGAAMLPEAAAEHPLVSVIVPAWNANDTLLRTLESAGAQTYPNFEIIIIDDGSTDETPAIATTFCAREPRARLIRQENRGLSAARNRGVRESHGSWIAPLDADDLWDPAKLEKQVAAALAAPEPPGLVYCWYHDIDEQDFVIGSGPTWRIAGSSLKRLSYQKMTHTDLLARAAVESVGGYDESLRACEDVKIQLQIAAGYPVAMVPEHLVGYRKRGGSMSRDTALVIRFWREVLEQVAHEGADIPSSVMRWMEAFFCRVLAEAAFTKRSYSTAVALYARAVRLDSLRWGSYGLYRLLRRGTRLFRGRRVANERPLFSAANPRNSIPFDPDEIVWFAKLLDKIEMSRLHQLGAIETQLPRPHPSAAINATIEAAAQFPPG